jgi:hypothetical protein
MGTMTKKNRSVAEQRGDARVLPGLLKIHVWAWFIVVLAVILIDGEPIKTALVVALYIDLRWLGWSAGR